MTPQQKQILDIANTLANNSKSLSAGAIAVKLYGEDSRKHRIVINNQISRLRKLKMWNHKMIHSVPLNKSKSDLNIAVNGVIMLNKLVQIDKLMDDLTSTEQQQILDYLIKRF